MFKIYFPFLKLFFAFASKHQISSALVTSLPCLLLANPALLWVLRAVGSIFCASSHLFLHTKVCPTLMILYPWKQDFFKTLLFSVYCHDNKLLNYINNGRLLSHTVKYVSFLSQWNQETSGKLYQSW